MLLDDERLFGQLDDVGLIDRKSLPVLVVHVDGAHPLAAAGFGVDHLDRFLSEVLAQDAAQPRAQPRLVHVELIGIDRALHDRLAEPVGGGDEHHVAEPRIGVEREHDTRGTQIAAHHVLHADGQGDGVMIEVVVHAVGDRAVVEQGGIDLVHGGEQMLLAAHVEKSLLLAGKGGLGQIFGGGRRAHRDGELLAMAHLAPRLGHLALQSRRKGRGEHPAADLLADGGEAVHVVHVERREDLADAPVEAVLREEVPVGLRGGGEAAGNGHAEAREARDHLADRGILAADDLDILALQLLERNDVGIHRFSGAGMIRVLFEIAACPRMG